MLRLYFTCADGSNRNKKEALIEGNWSKLKELAVCKNETHFLRRQSKSPFDSAKGDKLDDSAKGDKTNEDK